jgi:hypothetical protein
MLLEPHTCLSPLLMLPTTTLNHHSHSQPAGSLHKMSRVQQRSTSQLLCHDRPLSSAGYQAHQTIRGGGNVLPVGLHRLAAKHAQALDT